MSKIILADDGITFDGDTLSKRPLGGAETAFISLAEALAKKNHEVIIFNRCKKSMVRNNVTWNPFEEIISLDCDLYISNRGHTTLSLFPKAKSRIFWIHNPADYLLKWRYLSKIWRWKPAIIFSSDFHVKSYPKWCPSGKRVNIPYGISSAFLKTPILKKAPLPRVAFTSSPLRSLDWLLDIWLEKIFPELPGGELHIFSSPKTYGEHGNSRIKKMNAVLDKASSMKDQGVIIREPLSKNKLAIELAKFRALLYRGDPGETYCLAVGESQAAGVPCVVQSIGCVAERVINKKTGFVAKDDTSFANHALKILKDDLIWLSNHKAAIKNQRNWSWDNAASEFEKLI
jgi:glycosyltransferase involved in cell wall biosynthesis|tara:strand:- start:2709 stop:3740 length:1032 start_codon:yes stop_codon:yes gene_type:complete